MVHGDEREKMKINEMFKFKPLDRYLWIKETKMGIETYINPDIFLLDKPYKRQIERFLEDILTRLGDKDSRTGRKRS